MCLLDSVGSLPQSFTILLVCIIPSHPLTDSLSTGSIDSENKQINFSVLRGFASDQFSLGGNRE